MKNIAKSALIFTLLLTTGCTSIKEKAADGHYSGCSYIIESGDYYNVGIELHYDNDTEMEWNYTLEKSLDQTLEDLVEENSSTINLVEDGKYYCSDAQRPKKITWRKGYAISHDKHDQLIEVLNGFSFDITLNANASDIVYTSKITLPVSDIATQRAEEKAAEEARLKAEEEARKAEEEAQAQAQQSYWW